MSIRETEEKALPAPAAGESTAWADVAATAYKPDQSLQLAYSQKDRACGDLPVLPISPLPSGDAGGGSLPDFDVEEHGKPLFNPGCRQIPRHPGAA